MNASGNQFYEISFYDNDSYLLAVSMDDRHKYAMCDACKMIINKRGLIESHLPAYQIRRTKYHLSASYDGFCVVSQRFVEIYQSSQWKGLTFYQIPKNQGFYLMECTEIVTMNTANVIFEEPCRKCGRYKGVYEPGTIDEPELEKLQPDTFYRSDLEFAYDFEQHYIVLASKHITDVLLEQKLISYKDLCKIISTDETNSSPWSTISNA